MSKKIVALLVCVVLLITTSFAVSAQTNYSSLVSDDDLIQPYWTYIESTSTVLAINSGVASCFGSILCYDSVNKISITLYLEKKGLLGLYWSTVTSWSQTVYDSFAYLSKTYNLTSSGVYRVRAVYVAYSGSASESHTSYSSEVSNS